MNILTLKDKISFSGEGPKKEIIYNSEKAKIILFCLNPGQGVGPHAVSSEVAMLAIDGKGVFITGDGEKKAEKSSLVVCKENEQHGIRADTERFVVLAVISKDEVKNTAPVKEKITKDTIVNDAIRLYPDTIGVFSKFSIDSCCGGAVPIEDAAKRDNADLNALLGMLNERAGGKG